MLIRAVARILCIAVISNFIVASAQQVITRPSTGILDLDVSPNQQYTALVYGNGTIEVINNDTRSVIVHIPINKHLYTAQIDWSSDGTKLAAGVGQTVYIFNTADWVQDVEFTAVGTNTYAVLEDSITFPEGFAALEWSPDDQYLMGLTQSVRLYIWDTNTDALIVNKGIGNNPIPLVWLADGTRLTNGEGYFELSSQSFNVPVRERPAEIRCCFGSAASVESSPDRSRVAVGTWNGDVAIVDANTGAYLSIFLNVSPVPVSDLSWSSDGQSILLAGGSTAELLDVATGTTELVSQINGEFYAGDLGVDGLIAVGGITGDASLFGLGDLSSEQTGEITLSFTSPVTETSPPGPSPHANLTPNPSPMHGEGRQEASFTA